MLRSFLRVSNVHDFCPVEGALSHATLRQPTCGASQTAEGCTLCVDNDSRSYFARAVLMRTDGFFLGRGLLTVEAVVLLESIFEARLTSMGSSPDRRCLLVTVRVMLAWVLPRLP